MEALLPIILLTIFIVIGVPVAFSMGLASLAFVVYADVPLQLLVHKSFYSLYSFPMLAVPLFILVGTLMNESKITDNIFSFASNMVGAKRGGLGYVNVLASMFFAGMSGAALADLGGLGAIEIRGMQKAGYPKDFAVAITSASSIVGPIIPPSIPLVIYAATTGVSVGELFIAGFIPGILLGLFLMVGVYIYVQKNKDVIPKGEKTNLRQLSKDFVIVFPALLAPIIIIGGIVFGITTPTESASVAAIYAVLLGTFLYQRLKFKDFIRALKDAFINNAIVMFIVAMASLFGWAITASGFTSLLTSSLHVFIDKPWLLLLIINVLLLVSGTIMESLPLQILFTPILLPIVESIGISPVHFGLIIVLNVMIGMYTPPVGVCLYMAKQVSGLPINQVCRIMIPWLIPLILVLMLITYLPSDIIMYFPRIVYQAVGLGV